MTNRCSEIFLLRQSCSSSSFRNSSSSEVILQTNLDSLFSNHSSLCTVTYLRICNFHNRFIHKSTSCKLSIPILVRDPTPWSLIKTTFGFLFSFLASPKNPSLQIFLQILETSSCSAPVAIAQSSSLHDITIVNRLVQFHPREELSSHLISSSCHAHELFLRLHNPPIILVVNEPLIVHAFILQMGRFKPITIR